MRIIFTIMFCTALGITARADDLTANLLESVTEFAAASMTDARASAEILHAAAEDFLYEPTAESQEALAQALDAAYVAYARAELYAFIPGGTADTAQRSIHVASDVTCRPDLSFIRGMIDDEAAYPELTVDALAGAAPGGDHGASGFRALQSLIRSASADSSERERQYIESAVRLLMRDMEEITAFWTAGDSLSVGDAGSHLYRTIQAVARQSERNRALVDQADCMNDLELARLISANMAGLYQIWNGQYEGSAAPGIARTGLKELAAAKHAQVVKSLGQTMRELFTAARLLGDEKVRRDKDQHLDAFSARTRVRIADLLDRQAAQWGQLARTYAPEEPIAAP